MKSTPMSSLSAEEAYDDELRKLRDKVGPMFRALCSELAWLRLKWREYEEMVGSTPESIELLNSAAPRFFGIVQIVLWEDTLLHLARLTDNSQTGPKNNPRNNLTVQALPSLFNDAVLRDEVSGLVERAVEATKFARDWRNRHIAHRDLDLELAVDGVRPLDRASRQQVSDALSAVHEVLDQVSQRLHGTALIPDVIAHGENVVDLMSVVREGLKAAQARDERLQKGKPLPGDLEL